MELITLGVGGGWARPGGAACGYLLRQDGFNLWIDAGTGTMANLQRHIGPAHQLAPDERDDRHVNLL